MRLDLFLYAKNYVSSRTKASNLIKLGKVSVNGLIIDKTSYEISELDNANIIINQDEFYASLGGRKLAKALQEFNISVQGLTVADIGCSNGGFTDVLLQNNAQKVYSVDLNAKQLEDFLKEDERVIIKDKINARYLNVKDIGETVDFAVSDVSFISLKYIIPNIYNILKNNGGYIGLIKPQFECGKKFLNKKGIVKDKKTVNNILADIKAYLISNNFDFIAITEAPYFEDKNTEYLFYAVKKDKI